MQRRIHSLKRLIKSGCYLKGFVHRTNNVVIQKVQEGKKDSKCYIIGNGHSLNVTHDGIVYKHDPSMHTFDINLNKDYTVYAFYFTFQASSLRAASVDIASFIDDLQCNYAYSDIILAGHSKCGVCAAMATETCKAKVILVTISAPFSGTIITDKDTLEHISKFKPFMPIYRRRFSNHNVDKDITITTRIAQGVPKPKCKKHINIISELSKITYCKDLIDLFLLFLDWHMQIHGDGIVPVYSQILADVTTCKIYCSHARSLKIGLQLIEDENLI